METANVDLNSTGATLDREQASPGRTAVSPSVKPGGIRSVSKALMILELIARSGGEMTLTAIAAATDLNISTCHHLLSTLQDAGFASRLRGKRTYVLGAKIMFLYTAALKQVNLPRRAQRVLDLLNRRTRETVQIAVLQGDSLVTLLRRDALNAVYPREAPAVYPREAPRAVSPRDTLPADNPRHGLRAVETDIAPPALDGAAHAAATGKAILAWLPEGELTRIIEHRGLSRFTPNTITEMPVLIEELRLVRRYGYAMDREESQLGMVNVATAIRDGSGSVVGAIGIACPTSRADEVSIATLREQVIGAAAALSADLRNESTERLPDWLR